MAWSSDDSAGALVLPRLNFVQRVVQFGQQRTAIDREMHQDLPKIAPVDLQQGTQPMLDFDIVIRPGDGQAERVVHRALADIVHPSNQGAQVEIEHRRGTSSVMTERPVWPLREVAFEYRGHSAHD
jgi:hypothetical protein